MTAKPSSIAKPPKFEHSYAELAEEFFSARTPTPVAKPAIIQINTELAETLGINLDWLRSDQGLLTLAGNTVPDSASPIAMAYSGHQFGHWNPTLGDGRAILLGEIVNNDGDRFDFQLKGPGTTRYSRQGDGRSPLGPALREYIVSEAMAAMGIPTTRSLAVLSTGESVFREQVLPGGILTRIAKSHIRIGSFEYAASLRNPSLLKQFADYTIHRLYPDCENNDNPYASLLKEMIDRQAKLVAKWQAIGFVHGVMNTDNILLSGETVDYGPCAFIDTYNADAVFSSIDRNGRYAYKNQPSIAHWNLMVFAQALLPLLDTDQDSAIQLAEQALQTFPEHYNRYYLTEMTQKIGIDDNDTDSGKLASSLLDIMQNHEMDFTLTFRRLTQIVSEAKDAQTVFSETDYAALAGWIEQWKSKLAGEDQNHSAALMQAANPLYIPRNHLIEAVIKAAVADDDLGPFYELVECLKNPYLKHPNDDYFSPPPKPEQVVQATFCGT